MALNVGMNGGGRAAIFSKGSPRLNVVLGTYTHRQYLAQKLGNVRNGGGILNSPHCFIKRSAFQKKRKRAGCRRTRLNISKVNTKVTRLSENSKHSCLGIGCNEQYATTLDTGRNICTEQEGEHAANTSDPSCKAPEDLRPWAARARARAISAETSAALIQYVETEIAFLMKREPTSERLGEAMHHLSHEEWVRHRLANKGQKAKWKAKDLAKWLERYKASAQCCEFAIQHGNNIHFAKCRHRWCATCNRTRAYKTDEAYKDYLMSLEDPQLVTLTWRKAKGRGHRANELREGVDEMQKVWSAMRAKLKRLGYKLQGFKKLECTYNKKGAWYHPHYHLIIEGAEVANIIKNEWKKRMGDKASNRCQKVQRIEPKNKKGAIREVVKYCFKDMEGGEFIPPEAIHAMNEAFFNRRTHEALGCRQAKKKDLEPSQHSTAPSPNNEYPVHKVYAWDSERCMWMNGSDPLFNWHAGHKLAAMIYRSRKKRGVLNTS